MAIDINAASVEEIVAAELPWTDRALAEWIVALTGGGGRFRTLAELAAVEGITPRIVDGFRDQIVLSDEALEKAEPNGARCEGGRCLGHRGWHTTNGGSRPS